MMMHTILISRFAVRFSFEKPFTSHFDNVDNIQVSFYKVI